MNLPAFNHAAVDKHETVAMLSMIAFGALITTFILKRFIPSKYWAILEILLSVIGVIFIFLTGHYGGQMVYQAT